MLDSDVVPDNKPTFLENRERDVEIRLIKTCVNFRMTSPAVSIISIPIFR